MAAAVFGGSPRHHNRNLISNSNSTSIAVPNMTNENIAHNNTSTIPPQSTPIRSTSLNHQSSNQMIFPPLQSYISSSTPKSSSSYYNNHHHRQQSNQSFFNYGQSIGYQHPLPISPLQQQQQQLQQQQHVRSRHHSKRKSAVELLAESKPLYVKSETVLDRHQQLSYRRNTPPNPIQSTSSHIIMSPSRTTILQHQRPIIANNTITSSTNNRRSSSSSSDLLQNKLRNLLNSASDSKESLITLTPPEISPKYDINKYMSPKKLHKQLMVNSDSDFNSDVSVFFPTAFLSPQSSLPPHPMSDDDLYSYNSVDNSLNLIDNFQTISPPAEYAEDSPMMKLRDSTIRYASTAGGGGGSSSNYYQRSYSHSQAVASDEADYSPSSYNINSHKSMPDLHSQSCRHSPHSSEALSTCSRGGNRSNKSSSSMNRDSGASSGHYTHRSEPCCKQQQVLHQQQQQQKEILSAQQPPQQPPQQAAPPIDIRRDSGSSTQHSGNSYYAYGIPPLTPENRYDCIECRSKIQIDSNCLLNFATLEVPEAFQDNYPQNKQRSHQHEMSLNLPTEQQQQQQRHYYRKSMGGGVGGSNNSKLPTPPLPPKHRHTKSQENELSPPLGTFKRQRCLRVKQRSGGRFSSPSDRNCRNSEDDPRPILRSKSDIGGDRHWHRSSAANTNTTNDNSAVIDDLKHLATQQLNQKLTKSEQNREYKQVKCGIGDDDDDDKNNLSLEQFFEHLGLSEELYDKNIAPVLNRKKSPATQLPSSSLSSRYDNQNNSVCVKKGNNGADESNHSSPVFFSDSSTIDSNRLPDSTEINHLNATTTTTAAAIQQQQPYRPSEPTSIVERNARIIKWLCNCRKLVEIS